MPKTHAKLSPSAAERWINCPGSVALSEQLPPPPPSDFAEEGTLAHAWAEYKLLRFMGYEDESMPGACDGEMDEATDFYRDLVVERLAGAGRDAVLMVEQHLDLGTWVPDGFGTADAVIIGGETIEVIDFKYGKGVRVDAVNNPQLRIYGLGAVDLFGDLYDFTKIRMTIVQPRLDHVSTEELPVRDLIIWANTVVKPAAEEATDPTVAPHTACGDWCRWCPAKAVCRTRAEKQLELAAYDFRRPAILEKEEIAEILGRIDELTRWASDVQEYALQQAIAGEHFDGWKLVEGRSVRKYADDLKVAEVLQSAGFPEAALYERKLLGLTAMEKLVGKKKLTETLGDLIVKPAGKPVLVPEDDRREAINTTEAAKADFSE